MKKPYHLGLGFGIVAGLMVLTVYSTFAQFPDPKNGARLYELAKKERTIVWYGSSPLEMMKDIAKDFEPSIPVSRWKSCASPEPQDNK